MLPELQLGVLSIVKMNARLALAAASTLSLAACGGTGRYIAQPQFSTSDPQQSTPQAVDALFHPGATPYTIQLCDADRTSKTCTKANEGLSAFGIGGVFLPLSMKVNGFNVKAVRPSPAGYAFDTGLNATVDKVPPICGTVSGTISDQQNAAPSIKLNNFYCNWAGIGNVITNVNMSVDHIDLADRSFTGFYRITFYGTGNATGSGYFKGHIVDKQT